jgi:hypothetical protein
MATQKMKPFRLFAEIKRVDDAQRMAEGYAYVNPVVKGEGGVRLLRSTMEEASKGYMEFPAVREMHSGSAVGTGKGIEWDKKGCFIRAKIVDDDAWNKVKEGVYRGFSIGLSGMLLRGKDVVKADWVETSLVDRPADPDARITLFRAVDFDPDKEVDVDVEEAEPNKEMTRLQRKVDEHHTTITRLQGENATLQRALDAERLKRKALKREVKRLAGLPASHAPVRFPEALERTFTANGGAEGEQSLDQQIAAYNKVVEQATSETDPVKKDGLIVSMSVMKSSLAAQGVQI